MDGAARAAECGAVGDFTPALMNHSSEGANVVRRHVRRERKVGFYAAREVREGEELLLDYGKAYWAGRENEVV